MMISTTTKIPKRRMFRRNYSFRIIYFLSETLTKQPYGSKTSTVGSICCFLFVCIFCLKTFLENFFEKSCPGCSNGIIQNSWQKFSEGFVEIRNSDSGTTSHVIFCIRKAIIAFNFGNLIFEIRYLWSRNSRSR